MNDIWARSILAYADGLQRESGKYECADQDDDGQYDEGEEKLGHPGQRRVAALVRLPSRELRRPDRSG